MNARQRERKRIKVVHHAKQERVPVIVVRPSFFQRVLRRGR